MEEKPLFYKAGYSLGYFVGFAWPYALMTFVGYVSYRYWREKRNE